MVSLKKLVIFTMLVFLFPSILVGQKHDYFGDFLEKHYEGGEKVFLQKIYKTINYPLEARTNCGIGNLHVKLTLNPEIGLKEIAFLNPFGLGVEQDVTRVLKRLNRGWKGLGKIREFEFSIAYQISDSPEVEGDIKVVAYSTNPSNAPSNCLSSAKILNKIQKAIKKEKYKKVPNLWNELIRRGYKNQEFLSLKEKYGEEFSLQKEK